MAKIDLDVNCILPLEPGQINWSGQYSPAGSDDRWRVGLSNTSDTSATFVMELCKRGDNLLDGIQASCKVLFVQNGRQLGDTTTYSKLFTPSKHQIICDIPIGLKSSMCINPTSHIEILNSYLMKDLKSFSRKELLRFILEPVIHIFVSIRYDADANVTKGYVCSSSASLEDDIVSYTTSTAGLECADVELIGLDGSVYTHSFLLKSRSYILMTLIEYHTIDDHESVRIKFPTVPVAVLKDFVCFIERDTINNLQENAMDLFVLADQYHLRKLKRICENYLANNVSSENAPHLKILCDTIGSKDISSALFRFNSANSV